MSGFPEELLFRGLLYLFINEYSKKKSLKSIYTILLTSIIFSLMHLSLLNNIIFLFIGGIVFGILREETKKIYFSSLIHALYNAYN